MYTQYPPVYWATACLIVDGGTDEDIDNKSQDYAKMALALYTLIDHGITIDLPEINSSSFGYEPLEETNSILFGLKGINSVNDEQTKTIIENRPYDSFAHFIEKHTEVEVSEDETYNEEEVDKKTSKPRKQKPKCKFPTKTVVNLIKSGVFDTIEPTKTRTELMREYFVLLSKQKKADKTKFTASNIGDLNKYGLLTEKESQVARLYNYNKFITDKQHHYEKVKNKQWILATEISKNFFEQQYVDSLQEDIDYRYIKEGIVFSKSSYNKVYKKRIEDVLERINTDKYVTLYNEAVHNYFADELSTKHCDGQEIDWEFASLSFYHGQNPLYNVSEEQYGLTPFNKIPSEPVVTGTYMSRGRECTNYQIYGITGTVLGVNKDKKTVTILTYKNETVNVKFYASNFNTYYNPVKEANEEGKEVVVDESWFKRGTKLAICGLRRNDDNTFFPKIYKDSPYKSIVSLIEKINDDNSLTLRHLRHGQKEWTRYNK